MDSARHFISRIISLLRLFLSPLVLGLPFVVSIFVMQFAAKEILAYAHIFDRIHGGLFFSFLVAKVVRKWNWLQEKRSASKRIEGANEFDGEYLKNLIGIPAVFSYQDMEVATGGFSKEIGKGGFGIVYEGILQNGTPVAVKCLVNRSTQGQAEFCAEIATISSVNHSNLVRLHGICVEGAHRILVYEFMSNGSLDRWLFGSKECLDWKTRYSIALDAARGLAYLHEESRVCILHLDIKPQNILLDENFMGKVSDFGMARSLDRDKESRVMTQVRGTAGYMAPEWFLDQGITSKSDVFSYGMMLLEIISGRKNVDNSQDSDNWFFPSIAFCKARHGKMEELVDSRSEMKRPDSIDEASRLIKTAFWCIQGNSALRPSMGTVVRILEGDLDLKDPPLDCTFPFAPSIDYVKSTSDITLSIADTDITLSIADTDMACEDIQETGDITLSIAEEIDTDMACEDIQEIPQPVNEIP